ncbi:MAG: hypothetical protein AAGL24_28025 [Pseudomonadota bacterium]
MASCLILKAIKGAGGDLPDITGYVGDIDQIGHYALADADLSAYRALLLPAHLDQRYFGSLTEKVTAFLDGGGTLVFNGHVAWPMLPEMRPFRPLPHRTVEALQVYRLNPHPVFDGVDTAHLTYRRGVAGFYARGCNPPPDGAIPLHGVGPDRLPCDWVYDRPKGGRIFMHAGNDLWMYVAAEDTTARIAPQLCRWASGKA